MKLPPSLKLAKGRDFKLSKNRFKPQESWSIYNHAPQKDWPFKWNEPVLAIKDGEFIEGRVFWYHPAREIDHNCVISVGHPFIRIARNCIKYPHSSDSINLEDCFRWNKKGVIARLQRKIEILAEWDKTISDRITSLLQLRGIYEKEMKRLRRKIKNESR